MREDGVELDKIIVTKDQNYTPRGEGPQNSYRGDDLVTSARIERKNLLTKPQVKPAVICNLSKNITVNDAYSLQGRAISGAVRTSGVFVRKSIVK